jgi:hypothetical protein
MPVRLSTDRHSDTDRRVLYGIHAAAASDSNLLLSAIRPRGRRPPLPPATCILDLFLTADHDTLDLFPATEAGTGVGRG